MDPNVVHSNDKRNGKASCFNLLVRTNKQHFHLHFTTMGNFFLIARPNRQPNICAGKPQMPQVVHFVLSLFFSSLFRKTWETCESQFSVLSLVIFSVITHFEFAPLIITNKQKDQTWRTAINNTCYRVLQYELIFGSVLTIINRL